MSYRMCLAVVASVSISGAAYAAGADNTLFLHHLDAMTGTPGGDADYANGNPAQLIGPPNGPGGTIVPGGKFNNAIDRNTGGRLNYNVAGNYDINKGTMEAWIKVPGTTGQPWNTGHQMDAIFGSDTSSGGGDVRMYLYNSGSLLGGYMAGVGQPFWETEYAIPAGLRTANEWHHVAWQWDLAAARAEIYFDGTKLSSGPDAGTVGTNVSNFTATKFWLGEAQSGGTAVFGGLIDEFRISDTVRYNLDGSFTPPTAAFVVPEPASLSLLAIAGGALVTRRRRD